MEENIDTIRAEYEVLLEEAYEEGYQMIQEERRKSQIWQSIALARELQYSQTGYDWHDKIEQIIIDLKSLINEKKKK